jgi:hypothetical protein
LVKDQAGSRSDCLIPLIDELPLCLPETVQNRTFTFASAFHRRNTRFKTQPGLFVGRPFEAILVDFQRPNLGFQRRPGDAQLDRSPRHTAPGIFQCSLDHVLFLQDESPRELDLLFRLWCERWRLGNQFSSIEKISISQSMTERSMMFCNSSMFPGQAYDSSN